MNEEIGTVEVKRGKEHAGNAVEQGGYRKISAPDVTRTTGAPGQCAAPSRVNWEIAMPRSKWKWEHLSH